MVSTRGVRFKFTEGEKVLCYEPDPKKAKVLYDSKVLETVVTKDSRGRKSAEYLIHFNGWSSTWDRCVNERLILKDNEENRTLQKRLAKEAASHLRGGKKQRRIAEILKGGVRCKRKRSDSDTNNNSVEIGISDSSNMSNCSSVESQSDSEDDSESNSSTDNEIKPVEIQIPDKLRKKLEEDYILINKSKKLLNLPCNPNVVMILEGFVKSFVGSQVCCMLEKTKTSANYSRIEKNINLCKEVADGLRIYFDFTLPILLIYNAERLQYESFLRNYKPRVIKTQITNDTSCIETLTSQVKSPAVISTDSPRVLPKSHCDQNNSVSTSSPPITTDTRSNKKENSAELTAHVATETPRRILRSNAVRSEAKARRHSSGSCESSVDPPVTKTPVLKHTEEKPAKITRSYRKPLQQQSPIVNKLQQSNDSPSLPSKQPSPFSSHCNTPHNVQSPLSTSTMSNCASNINSPAKPDQSPASDCSSLLNDILTWNLLPRSSYERTPAAPSVVYGAQHLLRLIVKLPDLLTKSNMPENKTDALLQHLGSFLEYMTIRHEQLFSSSAYTEACSSVSTGNSEPMPN